MSEGYKCPTCGVNASSAYNRCNHPACPDGRDIGNRRKACVTPVVPDLESIARQYRWGGDPNWRNYPPIFKEDTLEVRELVLHSHATEIIAAKDKKIAVGDAAIKQNALLWERVKNMETENEKLREYIAAADAYSEAIKPDGAFGQPKRLKYTDPIVQRVINARVAITPKE